MTKGSVKGHLFWTVVCIVTALVLLAAGVLVAAAQDTAPFPLLALQDAAGVAQATGTEFVPSETPEPEPTPDETLQPEPTPEETPSPELTPEETPETTDTPGVEPTSPPDETPGPEETEEEPTPEDQVTPEVEGSPTPTPTSLRAPSILATFVPSVEQVAPESEPPAEPPQLTGEEWLRLLLSTLIVLVVAILGSKALYWLLQRVIERKPLGIDRTLLKAIRPLIGWWLGAIGLHIAILWVDIQDEAARQLFADLAFLFYLGVGTLSLWRLADYAIDLYVERIAPQTDDATLEKVLPFLRRLVRAALLIASASIALGRVHVDYSFFVAAVGVASLALSLAAQDTIADIIAGFTILVDRPFRIGDRIEIEEIGTWGDVVEIGLRTTRIRTRDNRLVIVPNSAIGKSQVVNYTYPDPRYRIEADVGIAYGTDIEIARHVLIEAVRHVEGVLPDRPVEALYVEMGDSAMIFCVRWWIESYVDTRRVLDQVHTALQDALDEAGIESPFPTQKLNLRFRSRSSETFQGDSSTNEQ
jgi:MscS family membrane protein